MLAVLCPSSRIATDCGTCALVSARARLLRKSWGTRPGTPALSQALPFAASPAYSGNYNDPVLFRTQKQLVPEYVVPAVAAR
jgi:hypothetical protein